MLLNFQKHFEKKSSFKSYLTYFYIIQISKDFVVNIFYKDRPKQDITLLVIYLIIHNVNDTKDVS